MNVLSLFDGISTGRLALERAGIKVDKYYASEIDTRAIKISKANWDDVVQLGDVNDIDVDALPKIDLLIGGSPCQGFSRAGKGLNFEDPRSRLFFKFVEILEALRAKNPDIKFLLENVNMAHEWRDIITEYLGVEPVLIDSKKMSAAMRERVYWTNIWKIKQPKDRGVKLLDVLDTDVKIEGLIEHEGILFDPFFSEASRELVHVVDGEVRIRQATKKGYIVAENGDGINISFPGSKSRRGRVLKQKASTITCVCNFGCFINGVMRKFTAEELEKLQTLPVGYTKFYKEDDGTLVEATQTARENVIGNGWTADVITYIFSGLKESQEASLEKTNKPERSNAMRKRFIYICSPCRGDMERNITKAQGYCREAVELFPDVVPIAPHVYCTQFTDDTNPKERALGMELGISLLSMCSELWVYGIDNPSKGMKAEIEYAKEHGIIVRDAVEVYQHTGEELPDTELGDALIVLPSHVGSLNGIAAVESTTVRISGEAVMELANELRKHRGHDITLAADQGADQ